MRNSNMGYYYSMYGLMNVKSNIPLSIPKYFEVGGINDNIDIIIKLEKPSKKLPEDKIKLADHYCWLDGTSLHVVYPFRSQMTLDLECEPAILIFSKNFKRFADTDKLIEAMIMAKFLQKGYAFIHAGAVAYNNKCIILPAMGRVGKTSTLLSLLNSDSKFHYMGDNFVIVDSNGIAYAYPSEISIYPETSIENVPFNKITKIGINLKRLAAKSTTLVSILYHKFGINLRVGISLDSLIEGKANIERIFILNKCAEEIKKVDNSYAIKQILTGTDLEMYHLNNYYISLYSYLSGSIFFHPIELIEKRKEIISKAIQDCEIYELKANNIKRFSDMILYQYSKNVSRFQ